MSPNNNNKQINWRFDGWYDYIILKMRLHIWIDEIDSLTEWNVKKNLLQVTEEEEYQVATICRTFLLTCCHLVVYDKHSFMQDLSLHSLFFTFSIIVIKIWILNLHT